MSSVSSKIVNALIKQFNNRKDFDDENEFETYLNKRRCANQKQHRLRYGFNKSIIVEKQIINGMRYYVFNRKYCDKTVFYYHGGAYINGPIYLHFRFVEQLLLADRVCVVFPIYPRIPNYTYIECYDQVLKLYYDFLSKNEVKNVIFMGDSAGGGLALGMAQQTKNKKSKNLPKIVLLSPWLDVATNDPMMDEIKLHDFQLSQRALQKLGYIWSKGEPENEKCSPLYGNLKCGDIMAISGTYDILYADAYRLREKALRDGANVQLLSYEKLNHDFILIPLPESEDAFEKLIQFIKT